MDRYTEVDDKLTEVFLNVLEEFFPSFQQFKFKLLFDMKRRVKGGKIVLASIELPGPKLKYFSKDKIAIEGYDYIVIFDKKAWDLASEADKTRVIRHELRHVHIDEKGMPKIVSHEIEDFYAEVKLNQDDPEWRAKLARMTFDVYEQEKEMAKSMKKENGNG